MKTEKKPDYKKMKKDLLAAIELISQYHDLAGIDKELNSSLYYSTDYIRESIASINRKEKQNESEK